MASKKKHLKYRATKTPTQSSGGSSVVVGETLNPKKSPSLSNSNNKPSPINKIVGSRPSPETEPYTLLTEHHQSIVKAELWHILWIALIILVLYGVLWFGFHYLGWSEAILRYIPHGQ